MRNRIVWLLLFLQLMVFCGKPASKRLFIDLIPDPDDAEFYSDTHWIDLGSPSARPYLMKGWEVDDSDSSVRIIRPGRASALFYCLNATGKQMRVRCKSNGGTLIPVLNGRRLKPHRIAPIFQEYSYQLENLQKGKNDLQFLVRGEETSGVAIDYILFKQDQEPETSASEQRFDRIDRKNDGFSTPVPSLIRTYFRIPNHAVLESQYGLIPDFAPRGSSAKFTIYLEDLENQKKEIASQTLTRGLFFSETGKQSLSLDPYTDQIVAMNWEVSSGGIQSQPKQVYWQNLRISVPPNQKLSSNRAEIPSSFPKKPNIFFYLIDALRGEFLQSYGYPKATSPRIDEFSKHAVVFEKVYAQSSWTRASVSSIVTGLYPSVHHTIDRVDILDESLPTLQAFLKRAGYHNYGLVAQPNVGSIFHFEKNFDVYKLIHKLKGRYGHSDQVFEQVRQTLNGSFTQPAFVYIHAIDTHRPYIPMEKFAGAFGGCKKEIGLESEQERDMSCTRAVYESLILQSDYYFGLFLDLLKERNLLNNSIVIVTADHGEAFMEHGILGHGKSLYEHDIRVPLIIHFPGGAYAGTRVHKVVRHIDLLPTLLEIISEPPPAGIEGASLLAVMHEPNSQERPVFSELGLDGQDAKTLILENYKIIATRSDDEIRYELFDLAEDPSEAKDLVQEQPVLFGYMKRALNDWSRAQQKKGASRKSKKAVLDRETEEQLKALGYLQ